MAVELFSIRILSLSVILLIVFHLSIVHLHDLLEYLFRVNAHLLGKLKYLRVQLLEIDVVQVDLLVIVFLPLSMIDSLGLGMMHLMMTVLFVLHSELLLLLLVVG